MSSATRGRQPFFMARTPSASSERSSSTLSLSLTDEDAAPIEDSFNFNDHGDVFLRGGNLAIGSSGVAMRDNPKTFRVAYEDLEIGPVIGKGSTGAVLEAAHKPTGTRLALKVINIYDKGRRNQLIREICTLYDASCPSLVTFYGAFHREGCITLALEMMDGGALSNLVAQLGPVPEPALANMVFQILWALAYLKHEKRVHRDVKPGNLLINSRGEVKVTDFGLSAELQSSLQMCGTFVGTFKYMSPERIRNQPYDYASDIWSLGLTLIECATGRYPYPDARNCVEMMQAITEGEPPTLPAAGPSGTTPFSPEFRAFLDNLLRKDPKRRLPPEILLGAPWLRQNGAVSLAAAVRNTRHWIHSEAVPNSPSPSNGSGGGAAAGAVAGAAAAVGATKAATMPPIHQPQQPPQQPQQAASYRLAPVAAHAPPSPPAAAAAAAPPTATGSSSSLPLSPAHVLPPATPPSALLESPPLRHHPHGGRAYHPGGGGSSSNTSSSTGHPPIHRGSYSTSLYPRAAATYYDNLPLQPSPAAPAPSPSSSSSLPHHYPALTPAPVRSPPSLLSAAPVLVASPAAASSIAGGGDMMLQKHGGGSSAYYQHVLQSVGGPHDDQRVSEQSSFPLSHLQGQPPPPPLPSQSDGSGSGSGGVVRSWSAARATRASSM